MRTLKRPMFKIGGKAEAGNDGIMSGLIDREQLQAGTALEKFQSIGAGDIDFSGLDSDFDTTKRITLPSGETQQVITPQTGLSDKAKANLGIISRDDYLKTLTSKFPAGMTFPADAAAMGADTNFIPTVEDTSAKDDTEPTITTKDTGSNQVTQAEKNEILKARAKEFEELLNPGARKRVINNALAAASGAFGKSTGNTMQDIANAITAAAGATGKIDETKQAATRLAIEEDIKKNIAQASRKDRAKGNYEIIQELALKGKNRTPDEEILFKSLTSKADVEESEDRFLRIEADIGRSRAVQDKYRDDESFAGVINNKKDVKKLSEDSVGKIVYHAPDNGLYKIVVNAKGELALEFLAKEKG